MYQDLKSSTLSPSFKVDTLKEVQATLRSLIQDFSTTQQGINATNQFGVWADLYSRLDDPTLQSIVIEQAEK